MKCDSTSRLKRNETAIAEIPIQAPRPGVRFPTKTIRKKATNGRATITQATDVIPNAPEGAAPPSIAPTIAAG